MDKMDEIVEFEPLDQKTLAMIQRHFSPIERGVLGLVDVDASKGAGKLGNDRRCIWTQDGHRITIGMGSGVLVASVSKEVDPLHDLMNRKPSN